MQVDWVYYLKLIEISILGHYQEEGIGVKGFRSDRGSISKVSPETPGGVARGVKWCS